MGETVESSTLPRPVPGCRRRSCEVSTLNLENCAIARRIHVFWVINPLFLTPVGETVESSTLPRPVPGCRRRSCEVSTLNLENCAIARRIHVFWVINPLFLTPVGKRWNRQPFHDLSRGVVDVPVKFQLLILKTVRMHVEFTFFE